MARGKASGCDGLPMEFYFKFWDVLGNDLVLVLNSAYCLVLLSCSQRRGIITLAFKKGDHLDPKNWRPITPLNADYKIASRSVAARLLKVIHLIVSKDQTCGVPGCFIGENVLRDVVDFCTSTGVLAAMLSLDQSFLRSTLFALGFGQSFIGWVDLSYNNFCSAVIVNGYISSCFFLSRGVRQGCPLSPLLYILISEVLACNIRAHIPFRDYSFPILLSLCLVSWPMPTKALLSSLQPMQFWLFFLCILSIRGARGLN